MLIPRALAGVDILGQARTGTGKTAAFAIPVLQRPARGVSTQAIILVPTRELAVQVDAEIKRIGQAHADPLGAGVWRAEDRGSDEIPEAWARRFWLERRAGDRSAGSADHSSGQHPVRGAG
jgi:superfamily II DNA or RNA helicase